MFIPFISSYHSLCRRSFIFFDYITRQNESLWLLHIFIDNILHCVGFIYPCNQWKSIVFEKIISFISRYKFDSQFYISQCIQWFNRNNEQIQFLHFV